MMSIRKYDDLIYDVGMHKGEDTEYYLKKGFRVIGFEADPGLAEFCRNKFSNEIKNEKLIVVEGAIVEESLGKKHSKVKFYKNSKNTIWGTVVDDWAVRNLSFGSDSEVIEVGTVDFQEHLLMYGVPHYLKIDIEGMDTACLRALANLDRKPDYVSMESEKTSFSNLQEDLDLLLRLGYAEFKAVQQFHISRQKEPNPSWEGCYVGHKFKEGSSGLFGGDIPGYWKDYEQILKEYKLIFFQYRAFEFHRKLRKYYIGALMIKFMKRVLRMSFGGWHDIHAKHASVNSENR